MKKISLILVAIVALVSACKYEEGPNISFRSKEARLVGKWAISTIEINGVAQGVNPSDRIVFEKDGVGKRFNTTEDATDLGSEAIPEEFVWEFSDDKTALITRDYEYDIDFINGQFVYTRGNLETVSTTATIVRLANEELIFTSTVSGTTSRITLSPVN